MKIETAIDSFIQYCQHERKYSTHTLFAYSVALRQFLCYLDAEGIYCRKPNNTINNANV
jgi:site-specific recombinase XerD